MFLKYKSLYYSICLKWYQIILLFIISNINMLQFLISLILLNLSFKIKNFKLIDSIMFLLNLIYWKSVTTIFVSGNNALNHALAEDYHIFFHQFQSTGAGIFLNKSAERLSTSKDSFLKISRVSGKRILMILKFLH